MWLVLNTQLMISVNRIIKKNNSDKGEGPQIHADKLDDVVTDQVDVDDLLSSLGF